MVSALAFLKVFVLLAIVFLSGSAAKSLAKKFLDSEFERMGKVVPPSLVKLFTYVSVGGVFFTIIQAVVFLLEAGGFTESSQLILHHSIKLSAIMTVAFVLGLFKNSILFTIKWAAHALSRSANSFYLYLLRLMWAGRWVAVIIASALILTVTLQSFSEKTETSMTNKLKSIDDMLVANGRTFENSPTVTRQPKSNVVTNADSASLRGGAVGSNPRTIRTIRIPATDESTNSNSAVMPGALPPTNTKTKTAGASSATPSSTPKITILKLSVNRNEK